ncbi:Linoleate 13S-lipoxygenase 2-1, chloroplastic [Linum grandiflorum]
MQPSALSGGLPTTVPINSGGRTSPTATSTTVSFPSTSPTSAVPRRSSFNVASGSRSAGRNDNGGVSSVKAVSSSTAPEQTRVQVIKAVVTVKQTGGLLSSIGIGHEDISDWFGRTFHIHLISARLHPETGLEKETIKSYAKKALEENGDIKYEAKFDVPIDFGEVGAVMVENQHNKEMFLKDIVLQSSLVNDPVNIPCDSWIHPTSQNPRHRIFFTTKSYLPSDTPDGLTKYREEELKALRGDGQGERKKGERIYDYDVYNDLGNPDSNPDLARPVLGGKQNPYPRRIRTGRPRTKSDPKSESRSSDFYVPRDEEFSDVKQSSFSYKTLSSVLRAVIPTVETLFIDPDLGFPNFTAIDSLYDQGLNLPPRTVDSSWTDILPRLIRTVAESSNDVLQFEVPDAMERDRFFWLKDEQFGRQTLAGVNPCSIELVKEWPLKSKLDSNVYGPPESAITTEVVEKQIRGFMTVDEAMKQKKLFIIDYHDLLLPFVNLVRQLEGTTLYGSRALFFLTPAGTLKPIAIELTRPPVDGKPQWKKVYTESNCSSTEEWLWKLAKAHVLAHDAGYHELVSH